MHVRVFVGVLVVLAASVVFVTSEAASARKTLLEILRRNAGRDDDDDYRRSHSNDNRRNDDNDDKEVAAEMRKRNHRNGRPHMSPREFLQRFGYLPKLAPDVEHEPADMTKAIKHFQLMYNMHQSGKLDNTTMTMMTMDRCGMPDVMPPDVVHPNLTNKAVLKAIQAENFYLPGYKWPTTDLTYRINTYWSSSKLSQDQQRQAFERAWKVWSDVAPLTFRETTNKADLNIAFTEPFINHGDGNNNVFDGPGMVLAHAFYPQDGNIHFDSSENWVDRSNTGIELTTTAAHEFGHALGLGHSQVQGALMAPYYQGYDPNFRLPTDDTDAIQKLYGIKSDYTSPRPVTSTTPTTTTTRRTTTSRTTRTTTSRRPPGPSNAPDTCTVSFRAATQAHDYRIYVFSGEWMWRLSDYGMDGGFPALISNYYDSKPPTDIEAVIFSWKTYYTYMFKGTQVWKYYGYQLDVMKSITTARYTGYLTAALADIDGKIYLLRDSSTCWLFDENSLEATQTSCPSSLSGMPSNYDTALRLIDDPNIYFFQGQNYVKYDMTTRHMEDGYPKAKAGPWMGPTCGSRPYTPK